MMDERYMTPEGRAAMYAELVVSELGRPAPNLSDDGDRITSDRLATVTALARRTKTTTTRKTTTTAHHGREEAA